MKFEHKEIAMYAIFQIIGEMALRFSGVQSLDAGNEKEKECGKPYFSMHEGLF